MIRSKRVYEAPGPDDGLRILVDRLWPRGSKRETAAIDRWTKDFAPSHELRKWFAHAPARWQEFQTRYRLELQNPEAAAVLDELGRLADAGTITLVYAASETRPNNAEVLLELLTQGMGEAERQDAHFRPIPHPCDQATVSSASCQVIENIDVRMDLQNKDALSRPRPESA